MDAEAFAVIAKQQGAELVLHGHSHLCSRAEMDGPLGRIPVLGISSASAASPHPQRRAAFRSVRIARTAEGWTTSFQDYVFSEETQRFITAAPASPKSSLGD
jgi:3',5'-cyclic AMP phosphodiesterase CpdA